MRKCDYCSSRAVYHENNECRCALCSREAVCPHPMTPRVLAEDLVLAVSGANKMKEV